MYKSDQAHMLDDMIDHPKDLIVSAKSHHAALIDTEDGNSVLVVGDFSDSMTELEKDVRSIKSNWPFDKRR